MHSETNEIDKSEELPNGNKAKRQKLNTATVAPETEEAPEVDEVS